MSKHLVHIHMGCPKASTLPQSLKYTFLNNFLHTKSPLSTCAYARSTLKAGQFPSIWQGEVKLIYIRFLNFTLLFHYA